MVQILPPKVDAGTLVGQGLGSGLSQGIQQGGNVGFQRGLLQNALQGINDLPPDTSPGQLASKLMQATAGIPGAEKYFSPLYQSLLEDLQAKQKSSPQTAAALGQIESGRGPGQQQGPLDFNSQVAQELGEKFFPNIKPSQEIAKGEGLRPQKPLQPPSPIGPAEESKIRGILRDRGVTNPAVQNEQIQKLKSYQNDLYSSAKEGFKNVEEYQEAKKARDQEFFKDAELPLGEAHGTMTPTEKSIWQEMSRQFEELPSPQRFANTEQMYDNLVGNPVIQFESSVKGLPIGSFFRPEEIKDRMEFARDSVQDHLKRIDEKEELPDDLKGVIKNNLRDQYFNAMGAKGYGIAQAAYATSNLNPKTAASIPKAPAPKETLFDTVYLSDPKERDKYTYSLANSLTKINPDDSLILLREKALDNNYDDKSFNQALNLALKGGLKLSDYQAQEKNKLSIPQRLDLDSIMEGKRSFYDYFKGKK